MKLSLTLLLLLFISININAQNKKETFDFIVYMLEKQYFSYDDCTSCQIRTKTTVVVNDINYKNYTCNITIRTKYFGSDIDYTEEKFKYDFNRVIDVSSNPENDAGSGKWSVWFNGRIRVRNETTKYFKDGRSEYEIDHVFSLISYKDQSDAIKMYKAFMHMKSITGFNKELF